MINILITSASRKVALVRSFNGVFLKEGISGKVFASDINPLSAAFFFAHERCQLPRSTSHNFIDETIKFSIENNIKLIVPTRDEELPVFSANVDRFKDIGVTVMVASPDTIRICQDKFEFVYFCKEKGFKIPLTYSPDQVGDKTPLFIKPRSGKGGLFTKKVNSKKELNVLLSIMPDVLVQEYLDMPEYTVDVFCDFNGKVISVVPRERISVFGGESFTGRTVKNPIIMDECIRLALELGLIGHNTVQCFFDGAGVKFIEVNPRFGGGASLGFAAGAHTPLFLVQLLQGKELQPCIGQFKDNLYVLRYVEDLIVEK